MLCNRPVVVEKERENVTSVTLALDNSDSSVTRTLNPCLGDGQCMVAAEDSTCPATVRKFLQYFDALHPDMPCTVTVSLDASALLFKLATGL